LNQGSTPAPTTVPSPAPPASWSPWRWPVNAGTTRPPRASSPPSNARSSTPAPGPPGPGSERRSSTTSKVGATTAGCPAASGTSAPPTTKQPFNLTPTIRRHDQPNQAVRRTGSGPPLGNMTWWAREGARSDAWQGRHQGVTGDTEIEVWADGSKRGASRRCSNPSAILNTPPSSHPASDTEQHLEAHHSVGRRHGALRTPQR
jgi:hypothetical protein